MFVNKYAILFLIFYYAVPAGWICLDPVRSICYIIRSEANILCP